MIVIGEIQLITTRAFHSISALIGFSATDEVDDIRRRLQDAIVIVCNKLKAFDSI
jgi:hypothetical protein